MNKKIFYVGLTATLLMSGFFVQAKSGQQDPAGNNDLEYTIPEQNGIYNIPNRPEMKVRVFVHQPKIKLGSGAGGALSTLVCGLTDPDSVASVDTVGWHLSTTGPWTYRLNTSNVPSSVGSSNLSAIAQLAFGVWSGASGNKVTFIAGSSTTATRARYDGQNIVTWGITSSSALAVTYTWYYPNTGLVAEVDTIMNQRFPWSWTNQAAHPNCAEQNSYDAQDILTHELGHWMGLDDEYTSAYVNNTMYGYGSKKEVKKDTLTTGDISGVNKIY